MAKKPKFGPAKLFISHATEDKTAIARPLAQALAKLGHEVWYDEFVLKVGDSLKRSIDKGLATCDFGVVILSKAFFAKRWTQEELAGLSAREMAKGQKHILPVWHKIDADTVRKFSPTLADRLGIVSSKGIKPVVAALVNAIEAHQVDQRRLFAEFVSPLGGNALVMLYANDVAPYDPKEFNELKMKAAMDDIAKMFSKSTHLKRE